jgi:hypothetical protein
MERIEAIGKTVFEVDAPIVEFGASLLANIDIPLLWIAKMIKRNKCPEFVTNDISVILNVDSEPFFWELSVGNGRFTLTCAINPQLSPAEPIFLGSEGGSHEDGEEGEMELTSTEESDSPGK